MLTILNTDAADGGRSAAELMEILRTSAPASKTNPVGRLFERMGLDFEIPACVRFHPCLGYRLATEEILGAYPAMVLPLVDGAGAYRAVQLLYLTEDGAEAPIFHAGQILWFGPTEEPGVHALLEAPQQGLLGVAVGLGSALAAYSFTDTPIAAVCSAQDLFAFQIPAAVERLLIFADATCLTEAESLKARVEETGKRAAVLLPATEGASWLAEFAFRGAIPVDDIALSSRFINDQANAGKESSDE